MNAWELAEWDAVETADHLKKRDVSATEVVEAAITRARDAALLGAIVTPTFERALTEAGKPSQGPLAGLPTFIKDLAQVEGVRTTWGTAAAGEYVSPKSDPTVKAFQATGMISLGKSATPEFGLTATTEPLFSEPCRNPWAPNHSTGGSSGGAGALVAAGVVPFAHGSDGGGSIRIPSSCCGLVGLKPSRRRLDMEGSNLLPVNVAVHGVLTRTVRDTVLFWNAVEAQLPRRHLPPIGEVKHKPEKKLRIGVYVESPLGSVVHPDAIKAAEDAAALCKELGHDVQPIPCPVQRQVGLDFQRLWGFIAYVHLKGSRALVHRDFDADKLEPGTRNFGRYFSSQAGSSLNAIRRLRGVTRTWATLMERYDVLMCPTLGEPPPPLGHLRTDHPFETAFSRLVSFTPFTATANSAGAPAISLPLGRSADGLPIGVQFAAAHERDALLLELAFTIEEARPWQRLAPRDRWVNFKK